MDESLQTTLDELLIEEAASVRRTVRPDANPEKGFYYRSDHFEFAKVGVPALYADGGLEVIGMPPGHGQSQQDRYIAQDYHQVSDEVHEGWDLSGAAADLALLTSIGRRVASEPHWPEWKNGSEFKARREAMLRR